MDSAHCRDLFSRPARLRRRIQSQNQFHSERWRTAGRRAAARTTEGNGRYVSRQMSPSSTVIRAPNEGPELNVMYGTFATLDGMPCTSVSTISSLTLLAFRTEVG